MLTQPLNDLISGLQGLPADWLLAVEMLVCFSMVVAMVRLFGEAGLYAFIVVGVIGANVQLLKAVKFALFPDPVALGTVLFASTYLCTDILTEFYGRAAARRGVMIGFASYLAWTAMMILTVGYAPLTPGQAGPDMAWALGYHDALAMLFTPAPVFFLAGMTSYLVSQFVDIWAFLLIRRVTGGRFLWLRANGSTMVSGLVDNAVFSLLAWVVLAEHPIGWGPLVFTYILGTYLLRAALAVCETPFMYLARAAVPRAPRLVHA